MKLVKKVKKGYHRFRTLLHDKPLALPSEEECVLIEELRAVFLTLPVPGIDCHSEAGNKWSQFVQQLHVLLKNNDPREFLRWDVILETMYAFDAPYSKSEFNSLINNPKWESIWKDAIRECEIGHPYPYYLFPDSSENLIHHAYHVLRFEIETKALIKDCDLIFEFGGGYGSMCRLIYKLGFKGKYIIFDFPEFSALQTYFLKSLGLNVYNSDTFNANQSGVLCISDIDMLRQIIDNHNSDSTNSLFLATWSISETPLSVRDTIFDITKQFAFYLIAYQQSFGEVNNKEYFRKWKSEYSLDMKWFDQPMSHHKGNNYLFGRANII